jgi:uncharacterized protein YqiB (DUF1249 family)
MNDFDDLTCPDCGESIPTMKTGLSRPVHRVRLYHDCPKGPEYLSPQQVQALQRKKSLTDAAEELLRLIADGKMPEEVASQAATGVLNLSAVIKYLNETSEKKLKNGCRSLAKDRRGWRADL